MYCANNNLKNFPCSPFKIGVHFKEQLLKKTVPTIFLKMFLFYESFCIFSRTSKDTKTFKISQKVKTYTKIVGLFFLLLFIIYWNQKGQKINYCFLQLKLSPGQNIQEISCKFYPIRRNVQIKMRRSIYSSKSLFLCREKKKKFFQCLFVER